MLAFLQVIPQATHVTVMTRNGEGPVAGVAFVYRDHHHRIETSMEESAKVAAVKTEESLGRAAAVEAIVEVDAVAAVVEVTRRIEGTGVADVNVLHPPLMKDVVRDLLGIKETEVGDTPTKRKRPRC